MPGATTCQAPHHPASLWQARKGLFCPIYTAKMQGPGTETPHPRSQSSQARNVCPTSQAWPKTQLPASQPHHRGGIPAPGDGWQPKPPHQQSNTGMNRICGLPTPPLLSVPVQEIQCSVLVPGPPISKKSSCRLFSLACCCSSACSLPFPTVLALQGEDLKETSPEPGRIPFWGGFRILAPAKGSYLTASTNHDSVQHPQPQDPLPSCISSVLPHVP